MPQFFIPITDNADSGSKRTDLITDFHWNIHEDAIVVNNRIYQEKTDGSLNGKIPFWEKSLTIDSVDRINLNNGDVINGADYTPELYPNTITQIDYMYSLNIGMLKAQGMVITDTTTVKELIMALIQSNVLDSDSRGKFAE